MPWSCPTKACAEACHHSLLIIIVTPSRTLPVRPFSLLTDSELSETPGSRGHAEAIQRWLDSQVFRRPGTHRLHDRNQFLTRTAQHVIHTRRDRRSYDAPDNSIPFELSKLRGQNLLTDSRQQIAKLGEAARAERQMPDNEHFPLPRQHIRRGLHGTTEMIFHRPSRAYKFVRTSQAHRARLSLSRSRCRKAAR